jgi:hypothetical protein
VTALAAYLLSWLSQGEAFPILPPNPKGGWGVGPRKASSKFFYRAWAQFGGMCRPRAGGDAFDSVRARARLAPGPVVW